MKKIERPIEWFENVLPETVANEPGKTGGFEGTIAFTITGEDGGQWGVTFTPGKVDVCEGPTENPGFTVKMKDTNFTKMMNGDLSGPTAFMTGKLKFKGEISKAMKLRGLLFA